MQTRKQRAHQRYVMLTLVGFLTWLLVHFGIWSGQPNEAQRLEEANHASFLILFLLALCVAMVALGTYRHVVVFFRFRVPLALFLTAVLATGFLREDLASSLRNSVSITLAYLMAMGLATLAFALPLNRALDALVILIVVIFLPLTVLVHVTKVGPLVLFPDRTENNMLRLGGLIYYAFTAMTLGVGGLIALYQFLSRYPRRRGWYALAFILANVFLLFTDCRSAWSGVMLAYLAVTYTFLSRFYRQLALGLGVVVLAAGWVVKDSRAPVTRQYDTEGDFKFRQRIWHYALQGIQDEPITGYGSAQYLTTHYRAHIEIGTNLEDPHSATLSLALQSGVIVTGLFFWLFGSIAWLCYRHAVGTKRALLGLVIFWVFVPFFWGDVYNGKAGFIQHFLPISCFIGLLHPGVYRRDHASGRFLIPSPTDHVYA